MGLFKHGMARRRQYRDAVLYKTYQSWLGMRRRCRDKTHKNYPIYGGRGITICKRWDDFSKFFADMGPKPNGMTLDRKNNNGNYHKRNCRWTSHHNQCLNRRTNVIVTFRGKTQTAIEWAKEIGMKPHTLRKRLRKYSPHIAISSPITNDRTSLPCRI